jgi:mediator of RNA polymerase II transcription subunit 16
MRHPYIPRCLSLQAALGFKNYYTPRTLPSSVAWAILNLQHVSVLFAYFFTYNKTSKEEPHDHGMLLMCVS